MRPTRFETTIVTSSNGTVVIALFDGTEIAASLAVLECSREAAIALRNNLSSALRAKQFSDAEETSDDA